MVNNYSEILLFKSIEIITAPNIMLSLMMLVIIVLIYSYYENINKKMYSKIEASNKDPTGGLNHVHPSCKTEAEAGVCKSDPVYMNIICDKSFCDGIVI